MEGNDVSVKRASTEVESDSSVSKKPKIEDEDDTNMEDESDSDSTDSGRAWSVEAKDDDEEVVKPPNYLNMQDPEPEWDKDSYDGYELVFDSDGREGFPNDEEYQEFREYKTKAWKNRVTLWSLFNLLSHTVNKNFRFLIFLGVFRRSIQIHLPHFRSGRSLVRQGKGV